MNKETSKEIKAIALKTTKPVIYMVLGGILVLAFIGGKSLIADQGKEAEKVQVITPTLLPTAVPTIVTPTLAPTTKVYTQPTNSYFTSRIKEIDERITKLTNAKTEIQRVNKETIDNMLNDGQIYDKMSVIDGIMKQEQGEIKNIQDEITALNAEKTQIMLKM